VHGDDSFDIEFYLKILVIGSKVAQRRKDCYRWLEIWTDAKLVSAAC
jgi:hypothetical protein